MVFYYVFRPRATLTFDLLTLKVDLFMSLSTCANLHQNLFIGFQNIMFTSLVIIIIIIRIFTTEGIKKKIIIIIIIIIIIQVRQ